MVVLNKESFQKSDSEMGPKMPQTGESVVIPVAAGECFTNCDSRGMLPLNQDLVINKEDINTLFRMDKGAPFATGLYAQVKRCKSLSNNIYYAAKFCPRKRPGQTSDAECIENLHEIALLSQLQHPYIISFIDAFLLERCAVTIMELAPGGDLQTVIDADLVLLEKDASRYIYQLLEALKYLHDRHVAHLDIKPQNLLIMGEFPTSDIKLCDFEISRIIMPGREVKEILGTPDYVAPEILLYEPLSTSADMWSVGILCYVLLTGFSPFGGDTDQETFRNIVHEPIDFPEELFEDISSSAIDFICKLVVKNAKLRPTPTEMEEHEWIKNSIPQMEVTQMQNVIKEPEPEMDMDMEPIGLAAHNFIVHNGPKKRSPRKTLGEWSGRSTASAAGRRPSARSILRACKSAYDLNKMGGKTKSREALIEKMKQASGNCSVGGNWKLRKNLSKSREQLWESKIQLSKSCERINNHLPGSARWASVANFPSLDLGAMKSSTSQESVISAVSACTNVGGSSFNVNPPMELLDWHEQCCGDFDTSTPTTITSPQPQYFSTSMSGPTAIANTTPPIIPNFDLSAPVYVQNVLNMGIIGQNALDASGPETMMNGISHTLLSPPPDVNYPSLTVTSGTNIEETSPGEPNATSSASQPTDKEKEPQKSVAELIVTFGGRVGGSTVNAKKLDLKNQFEPILEIEGSEEQPISLGDYSSDNNSTSGVSSIVASTIISNSKPTQKSEFGTTSSLKSSSSTESCESTSSLTHPLHHHHGKPKRTPQQIRDEMRAARQSYRNVNGHGEVTPSSSPHYYNHTTNSLRRGSISTPKPHNNMNGSGSGTIGLKGILKKSGAYPLHNNNNNHDYSNSIHLGLMNAANISNSLRRGSIPGNCTRLYDTHTISSLAKVPKKSILKNTSQSQNKNGTNGLTHESSSSTMIAASSRRCNSTPGGESRPVSKSPENVSHSNNNESGANMDPKASSPSNIKTKVIPKGLSPRERPSFILLNDDKPKRPPPKINRNSPAPKPRTPSTNPSTTSLLQSRQRTTTPRHIPTVTRRGPLPKNNIPSAPPTPRAPPKPRPSIREQIIMSKKNNNIKPMDRDKGPSITVHISPRRPPLQMTEKPTPGRKTPSPPSSPTTLNPPTPTTPTHPNPPSIITQDSSAIDNGKSTNNASSNSTNNNKIAEPAAVAIKIFPLDPAIQPKQQRDMLSPRHTSLPPILVDEDNNNNEADDNDDGKSMSLRNKLAYYHTETSLLISNEKMSNSSLKSPDVRRKCKQEKADKLNERSMWGNVSVVVCTGSIGRAMERFETGKGRGNRRGKLRRGSVPDF